MADPAVSADGPCVLECITYHEGARRMKERKFYGPFENFLAAHEIMHQFVIAKEYDDILVQRLHPKTSEPADEHPSAI